MRKDAALLGLELKVPQICSGTQGIRYTDGEIRRTTVLTSRTRPNAMCYPRLGLMLATRQLAPQYVQDSSDSSQTVLGRRHRWRLVHTCLFGNRLRYGPLPSRRFLCDAWTLSYGALVIPRCVRALRVRMVTVWQQLQRRIFIPLGWYTPSLLDG